MFWYPEYGIRLGPAASGLPGTMAAYDQADGLRDRVYRRAFRSGYVIVNGSNLARTTRLPRGTWCALWELAGAA